MVATFRCRRSGNTVSFTLEGDIKSMQGHEGYERIDTPEPPANEVPSETPELTESRPRGRPRKES